MVDDDKRYDENDKETKDLRRGSCLMAMQLPRDQLHLATPVGRVSHNVIVLENSAVMINFSH